MSTIDGAGLFSIEEHTHTKKGFQMFIAIMGARVERETFAALLDAARALGGWYTKPWGGTPGGFAFKDAAMARQFVADHGEGDATPPPAGEGGRAWRREGRCKYEETLVAGGQLKKKKN